MPAYYGGTGDGGGGGGPATSITGAALSAQIGSEVPLGAINGSNTTFTVSQPYVPATLQVFLNGTSQELPGDYSEAAPNVTFVIAPRVGDKVLVTYIKP